jgi:hypothetical protein
LIAAKAKENRVASGERYGRGKVHPNSEKPIEKRNTLSEVAKADGISCDTRQESRDEQSASSKMSWPDPIYW